MRIVTSPNLLEDLSQLDPLLATEGWNTLMTFTRESGCKFFCCPVFIFSSNVRQRPNRPRPGTKTSRKKCSTRLRPRKLPHAEVEQTAEDPALALGFVLIVHSRTRTAALTARFADYHCSIYLMKH